MPSQTTIASFVLRFVQETIDTTTDSCQADWHGVIKHVQSNTEQHFTHLADAITFMARYVELDDFSAIMNSETQDSNCATPSSQIPNSE